MAELTVDLTYGSALYEAAEDVGKRDEIAEEMPTGCSKYFGTTRTFRILSTIRRYRREKRKKRSRRYSTGMYARNFPNFLYVLIDKGRTMHLAKIIRCIKILLKKKKDIPTVQCIQ